jgi:hypothetical protein
MAASYEWVSATAVAVGAVGGAIVAGRYSVRREHEARSGADHASAIDGYDKLTSRLDAEIARLGRELVGVREQLAVALAEVEECERNRRATDARVAALEGQLAKLGVLDRRRSDRGRPDGGPDRRNPT